MQLFNSNPAEPRDTRPTWWDEDKQSVKDDWDEAVRDVQDKQAEDLAEIIFGAEELICKFCHQGKAAKAGELIAALLRAHTERCADVWMFGKHSAAAVLPEQVIAAFQEELSK